EIGKFEGHDFRRWRKKMHFLLTTLNVVYVLTTSMPELWEDATVEAIRIRAKWENDDYICRGHILNDDLSLVQLGSHLHIEQSLRAQDNDKGKGKEVGGPSVNITEKGGKNKHHKQNKGKKRSNENNSGSGSNNLSWNVRSVVRLVTSKGITVVVKRTTQMLVVQEKGQRTKVNAIVWWIDCGATTHIYKDRFPDDSYSVHMSSSSTVVNTSLWHARLGHLHYKRMLEMSKDELLPAIDENFDKCTTCNKKYVITFIDDAFRQPDPKRKTLGEKGIDCIFVGYVEHSKAYRFYVIEPNDSVSINSIIESKDAIFDENRFYSIPRPKDVIPNSNESQRDDHSDDAPIKGSRDQFGSQYSYCYSIEEDPRTYNKAMQSQDAAFWKEAVDDEIRSIMENDTWVLSDLPPGCKPLGCKWIFKKKMKVDGTINKFKARLLIQGFRQKKGIDYFDTYAPVAHITTIRLLLALAAIHNLIKRENKGIVIIQSHYIEKILKKFNREDCSLVKTPMDSVEKLKPNTGKPVDQLEYSRAIGFLMYAMTSTRPDIAYVVCRLSRFTSNPSRKYWKAITRIFKYLICTKDYGLSYVKYPLVLEGYSDAS
nr:zinc finger, CCHC-type [Tanacetum cinerariifolium]